MTDKNGQVVGSALLGQVFTDTRYFYGRPSAGGTFSGNGFTFGEDTVPGVSGGSNLGPTNAKLVLTNTVQAADAVRSTEGMHRRRCRWTWRPPRAAGWTRTSRPAAARLQVPRVAKARNLPRGAGAATGGPDTPKGATWASWASRASTC